MNRVALFGHPIGHSPSPAIHEAAFRALDLSWEYSLLDIAPEDLPAALAELRQPEWMGANVTIPYKTAVVDYLDALSGEAATLGAVNTIHKSQGKLCGENTDASGFLADLSRHDLPLAGEKVVILGSGGAARAVAFALASQTAQVHLIARSKEQAEALITDLQPAMQVDLHWHPWDTTGFSDAREGTRLLVNTTPVGAHPQSEACPWPTNLKLPAHAFIYDLIYNPPVTQLLFMAINQGLPVSSGMGMLIEQAAYSFKIWTGFNAPKDVMLSAAYRELEANHA
ncbi:MAG: shikimate dehydrogenase [Anaerolineales bacterium]|nr:shikimate dehydrogenase [Anaerolineales bacterium]